MDHRVSTETTSATDSCIFCVDLGSTFTVTFHSAVSTTSTTTTITDVCGLEYFALGE